MEDSNNKKQIIKIMIIFLLTMGYAVFRYNYFGGVAFSQVPSYIFNKSFSISALIFLVFAAYYYLKNNKSQEKYWARIAIYAVTLHILISLVVFSKEYFPKLFEKDTLGFSGGMVLLTGAVVILILWNQNRLLYFRKLMFMFLILHLFFVGYTGWITVDKWFGKMPPISLIGFVLSICGIILYFFGTKKENINYEHSESSDIKLEHYKK